MRWLFPSQTVLTLGTDSYFPSMSSEICFLAMLSTQIGVTMLETGNGGGYAGRRVNSHVWGKYLLARRHIALRRKSKCG